MAAHRANEATHCRGSHLLDDELWTNTKHHRGYTAPSYCLYREYGRLQRLYILKCPERNKSTAVSRSWSYLHRSEERTGCAHYHSALAHLYFFEPITLSWLVTQQRRQLRVDDTGDWNGCLNPQSISAELDQKYSCDRTQFFSKMHKFTTAEIHVCDEMKHKGFSLNQQLTRVLWLYSSWCNISFNIHDGCLVSWFFSRNKIQSDTSSQLKMVMIVVYFHYVWLLLSVYFIKR